MPVTILEGSTFCLSDEVGDLDGETYGFFAEDTRFLSRFTLTINGARPLLLSSGKVEYFSAAFYMRNPLAGGLEQDVLAIERRRFVGEGMQDVICVENESMHRISFELALEFANDFADILEVKDHDFALGDPLRADPLPPPVAPRSTDDASQLLIVDRRFGEELGRVRDSLAAWHLHVPHIRASWEELSHSFTQSVADLAALRIRSGDSSIGKLPAAGMPWFMTVFGRDTLITCLQTLLFGPEL